MSQELSRPIDSSDQADSVYAEEVRTFQARTPRCLDEWHRARRYLPLGVCSNFRAMEPHPIYVRWARGSRIQDVDGNEYVDFALAQSTLLAGHAHPAVLGAVRAQTENGTMTCFPQPHTADLAQVVCELFRLERVRFVNTGAEATQFAVRVARGFTKRDKIIKFDICYHGSGPEFVVGKSDIALPPGSPAWMTDELWTAGVPRRFLEHTVVADYNDLESVRLAFRQNPGAIAAVILEPIAFNWGIILPQKGFLEGLRELCDREGAVLIYDEVKLGCKLGRLGAGEYFGVPADLVCMAKSMGGGFPVGLFGGRRDLMQEIETGGVSHVGTYAANPVSVAAAYATLTEVLTPENYERVFSLNQLLGQGYREIIERLGVDAHVVTIGACGGIFLGRHPVVTRRDYTRTRLAVWPTLWLGMLNRGVLPQGYSPEDMWTVSVQHTEEDIEVALRAFREVAPLLA
jgi:glutamate-1-semialdehyde 2,1-aminomutase